MHRVCTSAAAHCAPALNLFSSSCTCCLPTADSAHLQVQQLVSSCADLLAKLHPELPGNALPDVDSIKQLLELATSKPVSDDEVRRPQLFCLFAADYLAKI